MSVRATSSSMKCCGMRATVRVRRRGRVAIVGVRVGARKSGFSGAGIALGLEVAGGRFGVLFRRAERQTRPPERDPNRPLDMRHLSEFSAGPENSHGASSVQTARQGGREAEPLVTTSSGNSRLVPAACAVRLGGRASALRFWSLWFPPGERSGAASQGVVPGHSPAPVSAFRARENDPEPILRRQSS